MSGFEEGVAFAFGFGSAPAQPPADAPPPPAPPPVGLGPGGAVAWRVHPDPPAGAELAPVDIAGPLLPPTTPPFRRALVSGSAAAAALAAERSGETTAETSALASLDLAPGRYEGGFKLWEGGEALARLLAGDERRGAPGWVEGSGVAGSLAAAARAAVEGSLSGAAVLELGAGAALPSLVIASRGASTLDIADFNPAVLERVSAVNVTACGVGEDGQCAVRFWAGDWSGLPGAILGSATTTLPPWSLILAAEVTYAPESLPSFLGCLAGCLGPKESAQGAVALVALKRYYFGVGGGTAFFLGGISRLFGGVLEAGVVASTEGRGGGEVPVDVVGVRRC